MAAITVQTIKALLSFVVAIIVVVLLSSSQISAARNRDMDVAIGEMQKANYFTFIMLINLAPPDLFQGNVTFLMPNDRMLSGAVIPESDAVSFLLRHSIPSALLFEHLQHFPTGSIIPTSKPDLMLRITNYGRRRFFLNNSRLISPNICTKSPSIRCHGIDEVLKEAPVIPVIADDPKNSTSSSTTAHAPPPSSSPTAMALPPAPGSELSPAPTITVTTPPPAGSVHTNDGPNLGFNNKSVFGVICIRLMISSFLVFVFVV